MTAAALLHERLPRTIGPYEVLRELGRGGMGVVYRAAVEGGPHVALKMPYAEMSDYFGCMRREIHALSRLRHPGIVRIIESGVERGVPWYAMELLDAQPLDELLGLDGIDFSGTDVLAFDARAAAGSATAAPADRRPEVRADLRRALTVMYRLARVLAFVHAHGIVHRDLKPQNILVRAGDRPVLADFGLMANFRARSGREVLEVGGVAMGTALYCAPEQSSGELVDARADLYSFGAMLYEIVTGSPPFDATSIEDVLMGHLMQAPRPPSEHVRGVAPVLERLVLNLLAKRRGDRLGYAEDVAELLVQAGADPDPDFEIATASYLYRPEMIGRNATLAALGARILPVRKGEGAFLALGGESGIGKTSVATAFSREATVAGFRVITGECDPVGGQPLHPLRPLLSAVADHCRVSPAAQDRVLGSRIFALRDLDPAIAALVDEDAPRIPAEIANRRLFADLAETLAAFAREMPMLLILDDLQWADEATLRFLATLNDQYFAKLPLLILGTYRSDETGPQLRALLDKPHIVRMPLGRLDEGSVSEIVRSMLAAPDAPATFLQFLAHESEGNPFFIAEYLRAAVDERLLHRESGRWRVTAEDSTYATLGLPGTLRDLVGRRLERLSPQAQRIVEAAAVLGREIPESLLVAMCGDAESTVIEATSELVERHVFEEIDKGVRFVHDKLREGAYARIPPDRLRVLHGRAAEVIEQSCTSEELLTRRAAELARHFDLGGMDAKAIHYYPRAAEAALSVGAGQDTVDLMQRALVLADRTPPDETRKERAVRRARWQRVLSQGSWEIGELAASEEHARRSLSEVGVDLPRSEGAWKLRVLLELVEQAAHLALPRRLFRARAENEPLLREVALSAHFFSARSYYAAKQTVMLASSLMVVNAAERRADASFVAPSYGTLALVASTLGLHRIAERYLETCRAHALARNDLLGLVYYGLSAASHYIAICDWKRLAPLTLETIDVGRRAGDAGLAETTFVARGLYELYTGQLEASYATHATLYEQARKRAAHRNEAWGHSGRSKSLILMGRLDEALEHLLAAQKLLDGQADTMSELIIRAQIVFALLHMGRLDEAEQAADATYARVVEHGFLIYEMFRCLAAPGEVYLELWSRARGVDSAGAEKMRRVMKDVQRRLAGLARRAPLALPVTHRFAGIAECLQGNLYAGRKLLRKSAADAARLGLPAEEGIAEYALARWGALDARERDACRERARGIFTRIGCDLYLRKLESEGA